MSKITIQNISKHFDSVKAVDDVTLTVEPGQFVTLLGPSGSGKTTTMRMIAGLERPTGGSITIGSTMVSGPDTFVPPNRRSLGMVFQSYAVWPHKSVYENIAFPLIQRGVDRASQRARVGKMLEMVELDAYGERYPSQLSGGQQQRVALARALVAQPDVILFDEPLSNLDAQLRESMRGLLARLHREFKITSVYVTHDQTEAMVLSDRVHVIHQGKLMQSGTPAEIYERPTSLFIAAFMGNANVLKIDAYDGARGEARLSGGQSLRVAARDGVPRENAIVIRPHQLTFADSDGPNVLAATVCSASYLGDRRRLVIDAAGTELTVELVAGTPAPQVGDATRIFLPPEACMVI